MNERRPDIRTYSSTDSTARTPDIGANISADTRADAQSRSWLKAFFFLLTGLVIFTLAIAAPLSGLWLYLCGELGVDRAVQAQSRGFALFGSTMDRSSADTLAYKLALYESRKPQVVLAGSAGMGSLRSTVFLRPMVNMAGTASSLSQLRASLDAMLARHKPDVVLLALDFWWFSAAWEKNPFAQPKPLVSPYAYSMDTLRMPWRMLLQGGISLPQFLFLSFQEARFGIRAQFADTGYGPDGSFYATSTITARHSEDAGFARTLDRQKRHAGEFATQESLSQAHLDALADIYFRLRGRGIVPVVFLSPVAGPVLDAMKAEETLYPHLFALRAALAERGIEVADTIDARYLRASECEFLDGTHAGEVISLRILNELTRSWSGLLPYLNMEALNRSVSEWKNHAAVGSPFLPHVLETDFLRLSCVKRTGPARGMQPVPSW